jgi:hypothetical protein
METTMANDIRNDLIIYGPQQYVDQFVGGFLRDGLNADVPIPSDAAPAKDPATNCRSRREQLGVDYWGCYGIRYPDVCFKTATAFGITYLLTPAEYPEQKHWTTGSERTHELYLGSGKATVAAAVARLLEEARPGVVAPQVEDGIACVKFYTPWSPPSRWIERVINDHYRIGLRFHLHWGDLANVGQTYETSSAGEFWTAENSRWIIAGHCAGWENDVGGADGDGEDTDDDYFEALAAASEDDSSDEGTPDPMPTADLTSNDYFGGSFTEDGSTK